MNNTTKSVLACLTLALCSLGSVDAGSDKKKCLDPIVGPWNFALTVTPAVTLTEAEENSNQIVIPLVGVSSFYADGNVVAFATTLSDIETMPKESKDSLFGISSFKSVGIWKQVGPCDYCVILSNVVSGFIGQSVANLPGAAFPPLISGLRVKTEICVHLTDNCEQATFEGTISLHPLSHNNMCFCPPTPPQFILSGQACKLTFCDC